MPWPKAKVPAKARGAQLLSNRTRRSDFIIIILGTKWQWAGSSWPVPRPRRAGQDGGGPSFRRRHLSSCFISYSGDTFSIITIREARNHKSVCHPGRWEVLGLFHKFGFLQREIPTLRAKKGHSAFGKVLSLVLKHSFLLSFLMLVFFFLIHSFSVIFHFSLCSQSCDCRKIKMKKWKTKTLKKKKEKHKRRAQSFSASQAAEASEELAKSDFDFG